MATARQPLAGLTIAGFDHRPNPSLDYLINDELNVKTVTWLKPTGALTVKLKTRLTPQLRAEGQARELIRLIQAARKAAGTSLTEKVTVVLPDWPREFESIIKQQTLAVSLNRGPRLQINRL